LGESSFNSRNSGRRASSLWRRPRIAPGSRWRNFPQAARIATETGLSRTGEEMAFRILWGFDLLVALVILYFFIIGLNDGSVSSFNIDLWAGVLLVVAGVIFGSFALESAGRSMPAKLILLVLAVPGALYLIFMLAILTLPGRWN
jgi:hypothetical protein